MAIVIKQNISIFILAIVFALLTGVLSVSFTNNFGDKLSLIIALPVLFILCALFIYNRYFLFTLILLFRPALDPILDKTKIGGFGVGGVLNGLIIIISLLAIFQKNYKYCMLLIKSWGAFLTVMLIAVCYAPELTPAIKLFLSLLSNAAIFAIAMALVKTREDYNYWIGIVLLSSLVPVLYGFVDYANGGTLYPGIGMRIASTFSHPNILAFYLVLIITLVFNFIKSNIITNSALNKLLSIYVVIMIVLLLLTKTRSAWVACFAFFALYGLVYERKYFILVLVSPFIALLMPEIRDRIIDLSQGNEIVTYGALNSYAWRKYIWESGLGWMKPTHYFLGYGVESFMHYSVDFFPLAGGIQRGAHSVYVQLLFDTGFIGLLSFIWLFVSVVFYLRRYYKHNKLIIFSTIMLLCEYAMIAYSDNMLSYLAFNWYFWFVIGATYSVSYYTNENNVTIN